MEKRKDKNVSLSTVIENREVELKVHRKDERALLRIMFNSDCTDVSHCRPHFYKMVSCIRICTALHHSVPSID